MRYLLCALAALALTGCGGFNYAQHYADQGYYDYNPQFSKALNVARATGLTGCDEDGCAPIRDVSRSKLPASLQGKTNIELADSLMGALTIGQGVGQIAGVANVVTSVGDLAGGLLTLGSWLTGPTTMDHPATKVWINAWMPQSAAASPKQAGKRMEALLRDAAPRQFNGYQVQYDDDPMESYFELYLTGRGCTQSHNICAITIDYWEPAVVKAGPVWVGNQPAYVWQNWEPGQSSNGTIHGFLINYYRFCQAEQKMVPLPENLDMRAYLVEVSANLPAWAYIYLPPTERHDYPAMLNQGKMLLFVEPVAQTASINH